MYVYIVSSIFKKADGDYKKYSIAYKTVELALEYVVADMEAQYDGAYADMMTDAVQQNVAVRGDYYFRYGTNDHYIMIEKMEVYDEQPKNVDNVVGFGLASAEGNEMTVASVNEAEASAEEEEANVEPETEANVETENTSNVNVSDANVNVEAEVNVNVSETNVEPENTSNVNVEAESKTETKENIEEMINESIDNADTSASATEEALNIQPDVKSGNITSEMYEENTIGNVATPQPTSISVGNADSGSANESDNVSALAAPASYSTTKGGVAKHKTRKNKKNGPRKSKRRTN